MFSLRLGEPCHALTLTEGARRPEKNVSHCPSLVVRVFIHLARVHGSGVPLPSTLRTCTRSVKERVEERSPLAGTPIGAPLTLLRGLDVQGQMGALDVDAAHPLEDADFHCYPFPASEQRSMSHYYCNFFLFRREDTVSSLPMSRTQANRGLLFWFQTFGLGNC